MREGVIVGKATGFVVRNWDLELGTPAGTITSGGKSVGAKESREKGTEESAGGVSSRSGARAAVGEDESSAVGSGVVVVS